MSVYRTVSVWREVQNVIIDPLNLKLPEQWQWKNTWILFVVALGTVPTQKISSA